jgi:hypothetical protein
MFKGILYYNISVYTQKMGITDTGPTKPFTKESVNDRALVIQMLKYEDTLIHGDIGKQIYTNPLYKPRISLFPEHTIHRIVLTKFGFDTSDESVANYRTIFITYHKSPTEYDKEVLDSVTYMRENKCVYYTKPVIGKGDKIPNCKLYTLDGKTETTVYDQLGSEFKYAFIASFSNS